MTRSIRVADAIADQISSHGTGHVFGVGGANIEDVYDAVHRHPSLTAILAKHEFSAATMAEGYTRSGAGLGVVMTTSGGACLNIVAALGEAFTSRVPVLAIVGQPPQTLNGKGAFQDTSGLNGSLDAEAVFEPVSVHCRRVDHPGDILDAVPEAMAQALRSRGPAVLLVPKDVQQAPVTPAGAGATGSATAAVTADPRMIAHALGEGGVTIVAGPQVGIDDARVELAALRDCLNCHLATTPDAKDVGLGIGVTGVMGHPHVAEAIADSPVCLLVGTRLPATAAAGLEAALATTRVVSIGSQTPFPQATHFSSDDLRPTLAALVCELQRHSRRPSPRPASPVELHPPRYDGVGIRYRDAMAVLHDVLPESADVVVDAGNTGAAAIHHLPARRDGRLLVALGMGGMGYSFGAAIGMAFGRRRRVAVIAGDGAFFMHGMEIHTAVQYRLPITFVLFNNDAHAMCVTREQLYYGGDYSYNRFAPSALGTGLSAMFPGLNAVDVDDVASLPAALASALDTAGPSVVSIRCAADEIPPFGPFLQSSSAKAPRPEPISTPTTGEDGTDVIARA
jgi:acetolactate synthase I/II/III large subunit